MSLDAKTLSAKIKAFYPEIDKNGFAMTLEEDKAKNAWVLHLAKGDHKLTTYIEPADAEGCLLGRECVHLSHQIGQFLMVYCKGSCPA